MRGSETSGAELAKALTKIDDRGMMSLQWRASYQAAAARVPTRAYTGAT